VNFGCEGKIFKGGVFCGLFTLATLFAFSQDGGLQSLAQPGRQLVNLVIAVDLDGLLRRTQGDHAMLASVEVDLQIGDQASRYLVIQKITELRQKL
jgi:hypothetical protein